jgi:streptogramin lyase
MPMLAPVQRQRLLIAAIAALTMLLGLTQQAAALPLTIFHSSLPEGCEPEHLVFGPSDSFWFVIRGCEVGRNLEELSAVGKLPIAHPTPRLFLRLKKLPNDLTVGPEGNLWLSESSVDERDLPKIGRLTPAGQLTQFDTPTEAGPGYALHEQPHQIIPGPENDLWFIANGTGANVLARITPEGVVSQFPAPRISRGGETISKADEVPLALATAANGNLWMGEPLEEGTVGLVEPGGVIKQVITGEPRSGVVANETGYPTVGTPDGGLWFREHEAFTLLSPAGVVLTRIKSEGIGRGFGGPLVTTRDGVLWASEQVAGEVLERVTSSGEVGQITFCGANETPEQMAVGPEGDLWFSARSGSDFGRLDLPQLTSELERERTQVRICGAKATARTLRARVACESLDISNTCSYQAAVTLASDSHRVLGVGRFVAKALHRPGSLSVSLRPAVRSLLLAHKRLKLRLTLRSAAHVAASSIVVLRG